jgi:spore cortex biosynthesis protein YabQ
MISVASQPAVFLSACLIGACMGLLYDVFRILRLAGGNGKGFVFFQDVLFSLICLGVSALYLLRAGTGGVRLYVLAGEAAGAAAYELTLGILVMKLARLIVTACGKIAGRFARAAQPRIERAKASAVRAGGKIGAAARGCGSKIRNYLKNTCKLSAGRLKVKHSMMYNQKRIQRTNSTASGSVRRSHGPRGSKKKCAQQKPKNRRAKRV